MRGGAVLDVEAGSLRAADVLVTGAAPHFLRGDLVEVTSAAKHRTRIPVTAG